MIARRRQLRALWLGLVLAALAGSASAATLEKLRVGQHPSFTRVVFELDAAAGYTVERRAGEDGTPLLIVKLDARLGDAAPRRLESRSSLLESVTVTRQEERSVATLRLRQPGLPVKEMILRSPARIVLDVVGRDTALVQRPVRQAAAPPPQAAPKPAPETPKPAPQKVAKPAPEPAATKPPAPEPAPAPPAPKPEAAPREAVPSGVAKAPEASKPPAPEAARPAADPEAARAEKAAREAMERRLAAVREAAEKRQRQLQAEKEEQRRAEAEKQEAETQREAAAQPPAPEPPREGMPSPLLLGGAVGLALALVIGLVVLFRRRSGPEKMELPSFGEPPRPGASEGSEESEEFDVGGVSEPLVAGGDPPPAPVSGPGLFDESEKGESAMETQVQVGTQQSAAPAPRGGADVAQLVSELERRISQLESGLEEANAARERLERQVVAQSEELRVQRAAIARTQRALRGLSRSDEEQATEPALRE